jgi:hypothetical protein
MSDRSRWWASFGLLALAGLAWVLATPVFAAPDEPYHVIRAASAGRGDLLGDPTPPDRTEPEFEHAAVDVTVPGVYAHPEDVSCFAFRPARTPECFELRGPDRDASVMTYAGYHSPAYYATVGFSSRWVDPGEAQVYLMRAIGALAAAALLASAATTLGRVVSPMWAGIGLAVAVTPMVLFLAATVSANGLETAAAIGVWANGAVLATRRDAIDSRVVDRLGLAAGVLVLSRALSPLWLVVIAATLLLLVTRDQLVAIARTGRVRVWAAVVVACALVQAWWIAYADPLGHLSGTPVEAGLTDLVRTSFGNTPQELAQMVGVFGWVDTHPPALTYGVWGLALGALAALVLVLAGPRFVRALVIALGAVLVLPVVAESLSADRFGFIWQGRYTLPLAVGLPLLMGSALGSAETLVPFGRRFAWVVLAGIVVAHAVAFAQAARRYAVGAKGSLWFFTDARWDPPVPALLLVLAYTGAIAAFAWLVILGPVVRGRTPPANVAGARREPVDA